MNQVGEKKALHVRALVNSITKGKIVAAELQTNLGEIVSLALQFYAVIHEAAKMEGTTTQGLAKAIEEKLISNKEKNHGEETGKKY